MFKLYWFFFYLQQILEGFLKLNSKPWLYSTTTVATFIFSLMYTD